MPVERVKKPTRKLEDDELFRQIGGQLDANFDYSQWQRQQKKLAEDAAAESKPELVVQKPSRTVKPSGTRLGSGCSSSCNHARRPKDTTKDTRKTILDKAKAERLKILQLRIQTRRKTIADYRRRKERLLEDNIELKQLIQAEEGEAHEEVKRLLRKYEKFRGGMSVLNTKFVDELAEAKESLSETKQQTSTEITALEKEVAEAELKLKMKQDELYVLMNYKDKEYPVKQLRISDLQKEIEQLKISHQEDETDLQHVVETEVDKFRKEHQKAHRSIVEEVTQDALECMHPSLKEMAMQNMVMDKEIEFHRKDIAELEAGNLALKKEVERLLKDPKTNIKMQMFPEFYPVREKCTPDMEVVLDIPTQEWLPI